MISQRVVCHGGKICSNKLHLVAEPFVRPDYAISVVQDESISRQRAAIVGHARLSFGCCFRNQLNPVHTERMHGTA